MGGEIGVHSTAGVGSEFFFELPLPAVEPGERAKAVPAPAPQAVPPPQFHGRVLVVEDDWGNQRVIESMLRRMGLEVTSASNGLDGLELVARQSWTLVFMDMQMPDIRGSEVTQRIRALGPYAKLPIIALTANARAEDREECFAAGMNDFLAKPVRLQDLQACLRRWIVPPPAPGGK